MKSSLLTLHCYEIYHPEWSYEILEVLFQRGYKIQMLHNFISNGTETLVRKNNKDGSSVVNYSNGNDQREYTWFPNGNMRSSLFYRGITKGGTHTYYYPNGNKQREEHYVQNELHGVSITWHDNGQEETRTLYDHGVNRHFSRWDPEGNLTFLKNSIDDHHSIAYIYEKNRYYKEYYTDKVCTKTEIYEDGELVQE